MADLWRSKGGSDVDRRTRWASSASWSPAATRTPATRPARAGLWQILGQLVPGNLFNPGVNALNAIAKYKAQGLHAWDASRSKWEPLLGKKVGPDLNPLN
jgi:hypothetical protein